MGSVSAPGSKVPVEQRDTGGRRLSLPGAIALIVGNVIGTGIFLLPATLAQYGTISIVAFLLVTLGAVCLAGVFGRLGRRMPSAGGPYAYARQGFGEFAGFLSAWSFWITAWAGNAGIAVAWVGYVNYFLHWENTLGKIVIALVGIWVPAIVNLTGVRNMGLFQIVTTVLKFVPLLFIGIVGMFFISSANFGPFIVGGANPIAAISLAGAVLLFIYSGIESVAIAAEKIVNPERNVGRASLFGTLACAVVYLLGTLAVMGNVPQPTLAASEAPFADAINNMFGGTIWGAVMAVIAIISGLGALNGWTLLVAEMPMASARDGLFPRLFTAENRNGTLWAGILIGSVLTSLVMVISYFGAENVFESILLIATFTTVVPYMFSAGAQLFWLVTRRGGDRTGLGRNITIAVIALLFGFWMIYGSGESAVFYGTIMLLVGIPVFVWAKASRGQYGPSDGGAERGSNAVPR